MERESMISEDDLHRAQQKIQEKTDAYIKKIDAVAKEKEEEIMTI
jgi:ribosome recycling factor